MENEYFYFFKIISLFQAYLVAVENLYSFDDTHLRLYYGYGLRKVHSFQTKERNAIN